MVKYSYPHIEDNLNYNEYINIFIVVKAVNKQREIKNYQHYPQRVDKIKSTKRKTSSYLCG